MNRIALLLTCFNRREITLQCLKRLFAIKPDVEVFLVDDNSTDGTFEAVKNLFPQVYLIKGTGTLFWNRGMHLAWKHAAMFDYDCYLWLNDDVFLYDSCFDEMFACLELLGGRGIVSGVIETHDKSRVIYGGFDKNKNIIIPNGKCSEICFMNGNFVLVPKSVFKELGNLDPVYHHDLGDVDYGLRAWKHDITVVSTRVPVASGESNDVCRVRLSGVSLVSRFRNLFSPLGSHPNISFYFRKKHYGYCNALVYCLYIIVLNIMPDFIVHKLFNQRYR